MTYSESAEDVMIDRARVMKELRKHGIDADDMENFFIDVKANANGRWNAGDVMRWLGY